ncbi:hypothetical protein NESM_000665400 [Novymonas esmeraldas]|uniref:Uncharacterized protein n=1 Tax=Novymonas esmeraldas TaxID=1808958 RepID=A0AAW0ESH9_9TRYP
MGTANSCACGDATTYRFKDFILSVYPSSTHGGPDEEALGRLQSYVASNPERIPRVCRKIDKILRVHVAKGKADRVMVSVWMLRSLIEHAPRVDDFVPHSIDMCALLLSTSVTRYHVGAADVLSALCHRLSTLPNTDSARRLMADNKDLLVPQLLKMTSDRISSRKDAQAVQTRYAAIVALSHMANCIHTALAGSAPAIMQAMIINLILVLRERAQKPLSDASVRLLTRRHYGGADAASVASPTVQLPADTEEQDVVYALACSHGIGATAACTTTAGVEGLLSRVTALLERQNGWGVPYVASLVFSDVVSAMQRRPQQLGFSVYRCLCEVGQQTTDPSVRLGVLRALQACVDVLPMTGGRPAVALAHIVREAQLPTPRSVSDDRGGTESARLAQDTRDSVVVLTSRLLRAAYRQRNAPQLQNIIVSLWRLLETARSSGTPHPTLALRLLVVAAPYLRTVPLVDRKSTRATAGLDVYLSGGGDDAQRHLASRVLTGILAGIPEQSDGVAAGAAATPQSNGVGALFTDEEDVAFAQAWVRRISTTTDGITPMAIVSVADVLCALMAGGGVSGLPFSLAFLWALQQRCVRAEPASAAATPASTPVRHEDTASTSTAAVTTSMMASRTPTSPLTRAWLHMIAAMLVCCGRVYGIAKLVAYGEEILERRAAADQLARCFEAGVRAAEQPAAVFTESGLRYLASERSRPLTTDVTEAPVSRLPSFTYVSNVIADADRADIAAVFGAGEDEELHAVIEDVCFQPDSEAALTRVSPAAAATTSAEDDAAAPHFTLAVQDEAKVNTLRSLRISVADNDVPRTQDSRGAVLLSAAATTTALRVQEIAEHFNVSAATHVIAPEVAAALPPLPLLPPPLPRSTDLDEDVSGVMSDVSESPSAARGLMTPPLRPSGVTTANTRSRSPATGADSASWVNPLDMDMGIRAARKAHAPPSARTLPAARYVVMA